MPQILQYYIEKNAKYINLFIFLSFIFVHFDPFGLKLTLPFIFLILLCFSFNFSNLFLVLISLSSVFFFIVFFNISLFNDVNYFSFLRTFFLFIFSLFFHIYFSTCSGFNRFKINYRLINFTLFVIFLLSLLQYVTYDFFKSSFFFNIFGIFSYTNQYDIGLLTNGPIRVTAFYLEPSYLAFAVINLYLYLIMLNKLSILNLLLVSIILILAGSRGGYISFFIFMIHFVFFSSNINYRIKFILYLIIISFTITLFFYSNIFSILALESISSENTSQFDRLYLGYKLSEKILQNYPFGIPLGQIEFYFQHLLGINGNIFSFFYLITIYFGFFGILFLLLLFIFIFIRFKIKLSLFLFLYLFMYFNLTGSLLAPDTYFWFIIFILLFRKSYFEKKI
jgi:hypothetical protein